MKKIFMVVLSTIIMLCGCLLTACSNSEVNLTYISLVNNSTGFAVTDENTAIAIGVKKGSPIKDSINEYLNSLTGDYKKELMNKMVALKNKSDATFEIEYDANHSTSAGVLKVGMECEYDPYNWTQNTSENGAIPIENVSGKYANGYDVQIAAMLASFLNMKLEIYKYDWDSLVPSIKSGTLTAIIAGMSPTADRLEEIDFSVPYYQSNLVIITREGNKIVGTSTLEEIDKEGIKIAAQPGTFHLTALKEQTKNLTVIENYKTFADMKMALMAGTIDGYVAEEPTAMAFCV